MTAVEWLFDNLDLSGGSEAIDTLKKAKEMERQQIIDAFDEGENNSIDYFNPENRIKESEQYYNETFKKD
jgi:hypothetical protein